MTQRFYQLIVKSENRKTGGIPTSIASAETCPNACPLKGFCYASCGHMRIHWGKVTRGERGEPWEDFCQTVSELPDGQLWRYGQAGDLPGNTETGELDHDAVEKLTDANGGRPAICYTHYPVDRGRNLEILRAAKRRGFTVNASANGLSHVDEIRRLTEDTPVVAVLPKDTGRRHLRGEWRESLTEYRKRLDGRFTVKTPAGEKVVICPATYRDDVTCKSCRLCSRPNHPTVGFPAHGATANRVSRIAENA